MIESVIDGIFAKEGDDYAEPPKIDQPTGRGGITLPTLTAYRGKVTTVEHLKTLTHDQARVVVRWRLDQLAKTHRLDQIAYEPLRCQMLDFAYNSGAALAIRWLQRVLRLPRTGVMDRDTLVRVNATAFLDTELVHVLKHQALIAARLQMIDGATDPGGKVDHRFEEGLENRALTFSLLTVP